MIREKTAKEHIQDYIDNMECIVKCKPYYAFALLAIVIEVLGKCMNENADWQQSGSSESDFNKALDLESLKKYKNIENIENNTLYKTLRCGLLHASLPKNGILLAPNKNNLKKKTIGCVSLYNDIKKAWRDIESEKVSVSKNLDSNVLHVEDELSGNTMNPTIIIN